jgi:hypothetical protein
MEKHSYKNLESLSKEQLIKRLGVLSELVLEVSIVLDSEFEKKNPKQKKARTLAGLNINGFH